MGISVALCAYNGERFLSEQLTSILNQTRLPDEIIVCDDRSSDNTVAILKEFAEKAPFPVTIHINEMTLGSTRNFERAIQHCNRAIIALADQDDVWYPEKLARIEAAFALSDRVGLVFSDADLVDESLQPLSKTLWQSIHFSRRLRQRLMHGDALNVLLRRNYVTGATMAFRSRYRELILPISPAWVHDGWIALLIAMVAEPVAISEPLIQYRQHSHGQIGTTTGTGEEMMNALQMRRRGYYKMSNLYLEAQKQIVAKELPDSEGIHARLQAKIDHLQARAAMPETRLQRLPLILRELLGGGYFRYSRGGVWAAARDFLL